MISDDIYAALPRIMVAPNGVRRKKQDHAAVPVTIAETVHTAIACQQAGAGGIHAHLRDDEQNHLLDAGLYRELQAELTRQLPDFYVQITTEAVGIYSPDEQRQVVYDSNPAAISFSIREMLRDGETDAVRRFYHDMQDRGVAVQHILYSDEDMALLSGLIGQGFVPKGPLQLLFVLGRYAKDLQSEPADLDPFLAATKSLEDVSGSALDWACCAFGKQETVCLQYAFSKGGKARIGFENNVLNASGHLARDNADRVADLIMMAGP